MTHNIATATRVTVQPVDREGGGDWEESRIILDEDGKKN
jgi:hypothetical protein